MARRRRNVITDDLVFDEKQYRYDIRYGLLIGLVAVIASLVLFLAVTFDSEGGGKLSVPQIGLMLLLQFVGVVFMANSALRGFEAARVLSYRWYCLSFAREERKELIDLLKEYDSDETKKLLWKLAVVAVTTDELVKIKLRELEVLGITGDVYPHYAEAVLETCNKYGRARTFLAEAGMHFPHTPKAFLELEKTESVH